MPQVLSAEQRAQLLTPLLSSWTLLKNRDAIHKQFKFLSFPSAFAFMTQLAFHAEKHNHHPEWSNVYDRVDITWSTHDCSGLSISDITLASISDEIYSDNKKNVTWTFNHPLVISVIEQLRRPATHVNNLDDQQLWWTIERINRNYCCECLLKRIHEISG